MNITIMRGISGSGKSTWVKEHFNPDTTVVCSTDDYFTDPDGNYNFDPKLLSRAHNTNLRKYLQCLNDAEYSSIGNLVVDNTNTSNIEIAPYVQSAFAYGWNPIIVTIKADPIVCFNRNKHGVPMQTLERQFINLNDSTRSIPNWWNSRTVFSSTDMQFINRG